MPFENLLEKIDEYGEFVNPSAKAGGAVNGGTVCAVHLDR